MNQKYQVHFIAPNPAFAPRPEGRLYDTHEGCQGHCDWLNDSLRGMGCSGYYKSLPVQPCTN